jgi:hypothetical protein
MGAHGHQSGHSAAITGPRAWRIAAPPSIELMDDALVWKRMPPDTIGPPPNLFRGFLRLYKTTDNVILEFARRYGVLGLCHHGLPMCHPLRNDAGIIIDGRSYCTYGFTKDRGLIEPLASWRALSLAAHSVLTLKTEVEQRNRIRSEVEEQLWVNALWPCIERFKRTGSPSYRPIARRPVPERSKAASRIVLITNEWMQCSGIVPRAVWQEARFRFQLELQDEIPNLFGFLASQLGAALVNARGWYTCHECSDLFEGENTVSPKRRRFCHLCRKEGKPQLWATRDFRAREQESPHRTH